MMRVLRSSLVIPTMQRYQLAQSQELVPYLESAVILEGEVGEILWPHKVIGDPNKCLEKGILRIQEGRGPVTGFRSGRGPSLPQSSQSLVLYGILGHAAGAEARHDSTVWTSERGGLRIAHQVQAVTFG